MNFPRTRYGTANRRRYTDRPTGQAQRKRWLRPVNRVEGTAEVHGVRSAQLAHLEAILFTSAEPISAEKLAEALGLPGTAAVKELIQRLRQLYADDGSAFFPDDLAGGYLLRTGPDTTPWLLRLKRMPAYHRLPATLLETLTVIAYKQPVTRADVEAVRGISCSEAIKLLTGKGLIHTAGRHASLGRPQLFATTKRFLQYFGLNSLAELPNAMENPKGG